MNLFAGLTAENQRRAGPLNPSELLEAINDFYFMQRLICVSRETYEQLPVKPNELTT